MHSAALWTDSRYFLAAADQLSGTEYQLMKLKVKGTPTFAQWLGQELHDVDGAIVGMDGMVNSCSSVEAMIATCVRKAASPYATTSTRWLSYGVTDRRSPTTAWRYSPWSMPVSALPTRLHASVRPCVRSMPTACSSQHSTMWRGHSTSVALTCTAILSLWLICSSTPHTPPYI